MITAKFYRALGKAMAEERKSHEYKRFLLKDIEADINTAESYVNELGLGEEISSKLLSKIEELRDKVEDKARGLWP